MKTKLLLAFSLLAAWSSSLRAEPVKVASFSTLLTEISREVGGHDAEVSGLVKPDVDPHEYEPTPADLQRAGESRLILTSGKHLGNYLNKVQEATGRRADLIQVGDNVPSLRMRPAGDEPHGPVDAAGRIEDPHWWHSVDNMRRATVVVRDAFIRIDPGHAADYRGNAGRYLATLDDLESWIRRKVAELPRDRRKLVTSHDAFQYFARDYGFTIYAIEGLSTEVEASNRHVSDLIDRIKREGVKAVFLENTLNPKVVTEITRETGARVGGTLYADGLGTGDAATYPGMMKHNVATIVGALK